MFPAFLYFQLLTPPGGWLQYGSLAPPLGYRSVLPKIFSVILVCSHLITFVHVFISLITLV